MIRLEYLLASVALGLCVSGRAVAAETVKHHHAHASTMIAAHGDDRPLTIGGRRGRGLIRRGNDVIAPGGFAAHGYGFPAATADERREATNERIRASASSPYGDGLYGFEGTGFGSDRESGSSNPFWGNGSNSSVGYNGVPTDLAFGPGFANRHLADHDPNDDDDETPGPTPDELGYRIDPDR